MRKEEPSQPGGEASVKWMTRGRKQLEDEPDDTPNSTTLVDKGAETNVVAVPEPAATAPEPVVKEEHKVSLLKMEPCFGNTSLRGAGESVEHLIISLIVFSAFFPISTWMSVRGNVRTRSRDS